MGYSIATPIKSEKAKMEMTMFLHLHYNPTLEPFAEGPKDTGLTYDKGRCRIGFNGTTISDYMIGVCAWMALKVGKRKLYPTKANPKVHGPYKYIVYDGHEDWPLYITQRYRSNLRHIVQVTCYGSLAPKQREFWELFKPSEPKEIYEELRRLDELWTSGSWRTLRSQFPI
jgi:hypothetical protein